MRYGNRIRKYAEVRHVPDGYDAAVLAKARYGDRIKKYGPGSVWGAMARHRQGLVGSSGVRHGKEIKTIK